MAKTEGNGFQRIISAYRCSWKGVRTCWQQERAFRQEILAGLVLMPAALWLGQTGAEKALLLAMCFLVLIVELLNTAVEAVVDRVGKEYHELSGLAKDLGSAAVLMSLGLFVSVWVLVLFF